MSHSEGPVSTASVITLLFAVSHCARGAAHCKRRIFAEPIIGDQSNTENRHRTITIQSVFLYSITCAIPAVQVNTIDFHSTVIN